MESAAQRHTWLEKELDLKEREDELELRKIRLEREEKKREPTNEGSGSPQVLELLEQLVKEENAKVDFQ